MRFGSVGRSVSLVAAPTLRPMVHISIGSKAPWFEITDDLPHYDELGGL